MWLAFAGRTVTDKVLAIVFPITAFVAIGLEHSIANMFFLPYGIVLDGFEDGDLVTGSLTNLAAVTAGNIVGGSFAGRRRVLGCLPQTRRRGLSASTVINRRRNHHRRHATTTTSMTTATTRVRATSASMRATSASMRATSASMRATSARVRPATTGMTTATARVRPATTGMTTATTRVRTATTGMRTATTDGDLLNRSPGSGTTPKRGQRRRSDPPGVLVVVPTELP